MLMFFHPARSRNTTGQSIAFPLKRVTPVLMADTSVELSCINKVSLV